MKTTLPPVLDNRPGAEEGATDGPSRAHWRGLEELSPSEQFLARLEREFPEGADELVVNGATRREFMGLLGGSMALAGVTMAGCIRKPKQQILPYAQRPENLIPGKPRHYATVAKVGAGVLGLLVESHDGRPTKIEGNPLHPMSLGSSNAWAQAAVLDMYDSHRSRKPMQGGKESTWKELFGFLTKHFAALKAKRGAGLALLIEDLPSPTYGALLEELLRVLPAAKIYLHDGSHPQQGLAGASLVGLPPGRPAYALERADVILSVDSDFLGTEGDTVRNSRLFADRRRVTSERDPMNRLYVVEPALSVTGTMADHRLRLSSSQAGELLADLAAQLLTRGAAAPAGSGALAARLRGRKASVHHKWVVAVAKDLLGRRGRSAVIVGERQAPRVHALGHFVNALLGNLGTTVRWLPEVPRPATGTVGQLAASIRGKQVQTLVLLGGNPVYDAPVELGFADLLRQVATTVHLSSHVDETSRLVTWHVPRSHFLEAWGDLRSTDGTVSVQQPLIAPLYGTLSELELLARMLGKSRPSGYALVREHWSKKVLSGVMSTSKAWNRALHDGLRKSSTPPIAPAPRWDRLPALWAKAAPAPSAGELELVFQLDPSVFDGRYATNAWLQELPDPVTKLAWDNAAMMAPATAKRLGVESGDMVTLGEGARKLVAAVWVAPGVAEHTVVLPLGYGRSAGGPVAEKAGFNAYQLRTAATPFIAGGLKVTRASGSYQLSSTQLHNSMTVPHTHHRRPLVRFATLAEYRKDPDFVKKSEEMPTEHQKTLLWTPPNKKDGQQWGMSIDLNTCTGCNACVVACQSENNIPVVGKERVGYSRGMHWIRIDRFFEGPPDEPAVYVQPVNCMQCENAPCEGVCPVGATSHSPEGLNDMAYNRCIGTRYCANNCPYQVRRFNFFNYQLENDQKNPLIEMQRNPDVTVRFRGVMEKCTYCVQRINVGRIAAKRDGNGVIADGAVTPACAQACPSQAIVFGDVNDPNSAVSRAKRQNRDYAVLGELNTQPRTTYLAKLRNPNPELA